VLLVAPLASMAGESSLNASDVHHLYVFSKDGSAVETYSTVAGAVTTENVQQMTVAPHPTMRDADGNACALITVVPEQNKTPLLTWTNAFGDDRFELVISDQQFVLCQSRLPNHDQLQWPPD